MTTKHEYGINVIEFHPHSDDDLQQLIESKQRHYSKGSETIHYKEKAAHIHWQCNKPLESAVLELFNEMEKGYKLVKLAWNPPMDLWASLRKPEKLIKTELQEVAKLAREEYNQTRYELNVTETQEQLKHIVLQKKRAEQVAAAEAAAQVAAALQRDEEAEALAVLLKAYAAPVEVTPAERAA